MSEYNPKDLTDRFLIYKNDDFISDLGKSRNIYLFYGLTITESSSDYSNILSETDRINNFITRYYNGRVEYNELSIISNNPQLTMIPTELVSNSKFRLQLQFPTSHIEDNGTWLILYYSNTAKYNSIDLTLSNNTDFKIAYIIYFKSYKDLLKNGLGLRVTENNQNYIEFDLNEHIIKSGIFIVGNDINKSQSGNPIPNSDRGLLGCLPLSEHKHYLDPIITDDESAVGNPLAYLSYLNDKISTRFNKINSINILDNYSNQYMLMESGIYPVNTIVFDTEGNPRYINSGNSGTSSNPFYKYRSLDGDNYDINNYSSIINRSSNVINNQSLIDTSSPGLISNYLYNINLSLIHI